MSTVAVWFWCILFVVVSPTLAVFGVRWVRRAVGNEVLSRHNEIAGFIFGVIGVVYAVLLGFTAIIVWEEFQKAQEVAEQEANAVVDLYRNSQAFPAEVKEEIEARLRDY